MPGQESAIAFQFSGWETTVGIKGQFLHMRGFTGWIVHCFSESKNMHLPFSNWLKTNLEPDLLQNLDLNSPISQFINPAILSISVSVTYVPPKPLQHSPHIVHLKISSAVKSEPMPSLHCTLYCYLIHILEIASHRNARGYS